MDSLEKMPNTYELFENTSEHGIFRGFLDVNTSELPMNTSELLMKTSLISIYRGFLGVKTSELFMNTSELFMFRGIHRMILKNFIIYDGITSTKISFCCLS